LKTGFLVKMHFATDRACIGFPFWFHICAGSESETNPPSESAAGKPDFLGTQRDIDFLETD
jgi:hypothetical protein